MDLTAGTPPMLAPSQQDAFAALEAIRQQEIAPGGRLADTPLGGPAAPQNLQLQVVRWQKDGVNKAAVQITFLSRVNTLYQVQKSTDLMTWTNVGNDANNLPIVGNNGLVIYTEEDMTDAKAFYRIQWSSATADDPVGGRHCGL